MSLLSVRKLTLVRGGKKLFENLTFTLDKGEIVGLIGKNGAGKTSLCLALAGLLDEEDAELYGEIEYGGVSIEKLGVAERARAVGIIFQDPDSQLFAPLVEEELAFLPENLMLPRVEIRKSIEDAAAKCGIAHLLYEETNKLSGGEKQRVAIASALTAAPAVLLADEITSQVDRKGRKSLMELMQSFAGEGGAVLTVTHNKEELSYCTRILELK